MKVVGVELGDRPYVMTKARRFAPEGVKVFSELLSHLGFADEADVVLDWTNVLRLQPDEVARPVLVIEARKQVHQLPPPNHLSIQVRLDVEDLFGKDEIQAEDFLDVTQQMAQKMEVSIEQAVKEYMSGVS